LPSEPVVTYFFPMKVLPSSVPEGFEKKRTMKVWLGLLPRAPLMVDFSAEVLAEAMAGLFCRSLAPVSASPGSLAVSPSPPRSMALPSPVPHTGEGGHKRVLGAAQSLLE
jgi:hypothetical protein